MPTVSIYIHLHIDIYDNCIEIKVYFQHAVIELHIIYN